MNSPVIIENRPRWAWAFTVLWAVETLAGIGFAASGVMWLGAHENGAAAVLIGMGLLLVAAGIVMTAQSFRVARLKGAAIIMSDDGLTDRRLSEKAIPWDAITWRIVFNGRSYSLHFSVAEPARSRLAPYWEQRALGRFNRLFGYPEFAMVTLGTGKNLGALADVMQRFRPLPDESP